MASVLLRRIGVVVTLAVVAGAGCNKSGSPTSPSGGDGSVIGTLAVQKVEPEPNEDGTPVQLEVNEVSVTISFQLQNVADSEIVSLHVGLSNSDQFFFGSSRTSGQSYGGFRREMPVTIDFRGGMIGCHEFQYLIVLVGRYGLAPRSGDPVPEVGGNVFLKEVRPYRVNSPSCG